MPSADTYLQKGSDPRRWCGGGKAGRKGRRLDPLAVMLDGQQIALGQWQPIVEKIIAQALEGSPFAQKLLADRIWPLMPAPLVLQQFASIQAAEQSNAVTVPGTGLSGLLMAAHQMPPPQRTIEAEPPRRQRRVVDLREFADAAD